MPSNRIALHRTYRIASHCPVASRNVRALWLFFFPPTSLPQPLVPSGRRPSRFLLAGRQIDTDRERLRDIHRRAGIQTSSLSPLFPPLPFWTLDSFSEFSLGPRFRHFLPPSRQDPPLSNPQTCQNPSSFVPRPVRTHLTGQTWRVLWLVLFCPVLSRTAQPSPVFGFQSSSCSCSSSSSQFLGVAKVVCSKKCHRRRHRHRRPSLSACCHCQLPAAKPAHLPLPLLLLASVSQQSKQKQQVKSVPRTLLTKQDLGLFLSLAHRCPTVDQSRAYPAPRAQRLWTTDATVRYAALPHTPQAYLTLPYLALPDCYLTLPCTHAGSSLCPVQLHYHITTHSLSASFKPKPCAGLDL